MGKGKLSDKLTDDELDRLDAVLDQFPGAMNVETMDGFFAALICAPEMFSIGEANCKSGAKRRSLQTKMTRVKLQRS